jgi:hypothetical protein
MDTNPQNLIGIGSGNGVSIQHRRIGAHKGARGGREVGNRVLENPFPLRHPISIRSVLMGIQAAQEWTEKVDRVMVDSNDVSGDASYGRAREFASRFGPKWRGVMQGLDRNN